MICRKSESGLAPYLNATPLRLRVGSRVHLHFRTGASGEIRTLKHLFLRQAAIPIRARWHMVHRGGFEPPRPTWGDRVTAGPFRPGSRTCAFRSFAAKYAAQDFACGLPAFPLLTLRVQLPAPQIGSTWRKVDESNAHGSSPCPGFQDQLPTIQRYLPQWRRVRESNPLASCENPCLADKCLTVRPTLR